MQGTLDLYVLFPTIVCVLQLSQNKNSIIKKETSEIKEQRYLLSHETESFWSTLDVPNAIRVRAEF